MFFIQLIDMNAKHLTTLCGPSFLPEFLVLFVTSTGSTGGFVNAATESDNEKAALAALYLASWLLLLVVIGHSIVLLICFAGFLVM